MMSQCFHPIDLKGRVIYRSFFQRNISGALGGGGGGGIGVLLLDILDEVEIIDFLQPRIEQKLLKNIMITPQVFLIEIDYVQPLSQFMRVKLGACFGPGPFSLDTMIKTMIRGSFV